ncbi:MAG: hypothetical protein WA124_12300, partial [Smithella sp.]
DSGSDMTQSMLSKSNLWCQELFQGTHLSKIAKLFLGNCRRSVKELGRLPVVNFAAGGIATPADAALLIQFGCDGIFVGSGIFKSTNPEARARAIVKATAYFNDPQKVLEASTSIGEAMPGLEISQIPSEQLLAGRGW